MWAARAAELREKAELGTLTRDCSGSRLAHHRTCIDLDESNRHSNLNVRYVHGLELEMYEIDENRCNVQNYNNTHTKFLLSKRFFHGTRLSRQYFLIVSQVN